MDDLKRCGDRWLAAFTASEYDRLETMLDPSVRFRALIPGGLREETGPVDAVRAIRDWFGDCDVVVLRRGEVDIVADRVRVHYLLDVREKGEWFAVDQTMFGTMGAAGLGRVDLLCSGFRDIEIPSDQLGRPGPV